MKPASVAMSTRYTVAPAIGVHDITGGSAVCRSATGARVRAGATAGAAGAYTSRSGADQALTMPPTLARTRHQSCPAGRPVCSAAFGTTVVPAVATLSLM